MKPLVFLDFDGVIMTAGSYERAPGAPRPFGEFREAAAVARMDPALVANVSTLCERIGADVVLSTSWRGSTEEDREALEAALWARGLARAVPVVGQTPHGRSGWRGDEIVAWLDANRPGWTREAVVVLDDDGDLDPLLDRWVQSTWEAGFGADQLAEALALFGVTLPSGGASADGPAFERWDDERNATLIEGVPGPLFAGRHP